MEYQVFARKFRPQQFDTIIGQDHIVTTLKNAIKQNRIAQSFLFVGTRGVGKTSTARILAKALNCSGERKESFESCDACPSCLEIKEGTGFDVLEIDGASNRGIDEIRNLRDNVKFKPMHGKYKVYIIDEVHMLTSEAFNALLKTLEEPPPHVKFIFATTEAHKIPQTILSRTQRYDFRQIGTSFIVKALEAIAKTETINIDERTLFLVAKNAEGSLRDAESLLDKLAASLSKKIVFEEALHILGVTDTLIYFELIEKTLKRDGEGVLQIITTEEESGKDLVHFTKGLLEQLRDMMVLKAAKKSDKFLTVSKEDQEHLTRLTEMTSLKEILYCFTVIQNTHRTMKFSPFPRIDLEAALLKLVTRENIQELAQLITDLQNLKKQLGVSGGKVALERSAASRINVTHKNSTSVASSMPSSSSEVNQQQINAEVQAKKSIAQSAIAEEEPPIIDEDIEEEPEPLATPDDFPVTDELGKIRKSWADLVRAVKTEKMSLGTFLTTGKPISYKDQKLVIAFSQENKFHKETVEIKQNKQIIEQQFSKILAHPLRVDFIINNLVDNVTDGKTDPKDSAQMDTVIKSALDIFQGRVIS